MQKFYMRRADHAEETQCKRVRKFKIGSCSIVHDHENARARVCAWSREDMAVGPFG